MSVPARIGAYEILGQLAEGGMGAIYLARHAALGGFERHVVLKTLALRDDDVDPEAMFLDEARLLGQLHHHHIAAVYDVGRADDLLYMVLEYVHGKDAAEVWDRTSYFGAALPIDFALTVTAAAAAGLHYAHTRRGSDGAPLRIVHRDVSLSNLMIGFDGAVKLIDFGIAKAAQRSTQTQVGLVKGKIGYLAPEQLRGQPVDARTDVFALGIVLYELTTMTRPFRADSDQETLDRIAKGQVRPPSSIIPDFPPELERIIARALRVDPRERYPDAEAMRRDVEVLGQRMGMVLGDAAIDEVMGQLYDDRSEPWTRAGRAGTELEVPLEIGASEPLPEAPAPRKLRAATQIRAQTIEASEEAIEEEIVEEPEQGRRQPTMIGPGPEAKRPSAPHPSVPAPAARPSGPRPSAPALETGEQIKPPTGAAAVDAPRGAVRPALRGRSRLPWVIGALVLVAGAAVLVAVLVGGDSQANPQQAAADATVDAASAAATVDASSAAATVDAASLAAPPDAMAVGAPPDAAAPSDAPSRPPADASSAAADAGAASAAAQVRLTVITTPDDATLLLDGKRLGRTPFEGSVDRSPGTHVLKIRKRGFAAVKLEISLEADVRHELTLVKDKPAEPEPEQPETFELP